MQRSIVFGFLISGLAILPFLSCVSMAEAAEFKSEEGISFQYPDDWVAVTQVNQEQLAPQVRAYLQENHMDLSATLVMVMRLNEGDFVENFNVVMVPQQIPATAASLPKLQSQKSDQSKKSGIQITELTGNLIDIADRKCINFTHKTQLPFVEGLLQQRQVMIPGGGKTFVITLTALPTTYEKHIATFDAVLHSLQVLPPEDDPMWFKLGRLCGMIIGIPLGLYAWHLIKKRWGAPNREA